MNCEGEVYFALYGDFEPESLFLGVAATRTKKRGDPTPKQSWWIYSSGKIHGGVIDVYELGDSLISALEPHAAAIVEVKQRLSLEAILQVVLKLPAAAGASTPAIGFSSDVVSFLNKVGASIDVDTYIGES